MKNKTKPMILSLSGHDPSGGAGIQADIEAIHAFGCHATSVITCLTQQDTKNVYQIRPVDTQWFLEQVQTVLEDMPVQAIKIGLIGSLEKIDAIEKILCQHSEIPVILDPVLTAGGGQDLSSEAIAQAIASQLLPHTTIVTPNIPEAHQLSDLNENNACAQFFSDQGCQYSLITGTHSDTKEVTNTFYQAKENGSTNIISELHWPRLPAVYHGSGCTLASSIAACIGSSIIPKNAVKLAQAYTWNALDKATTQGDGQLIPSR